MLLLKEYHSCVLFKEEKEWKMLVKGMVMYEGKGVVSVTKQAKSFLAYWTGSHDDFLLLGRSPSPTVQSTSVKRTVERDELFRAISPHQPPLGKIHLSFRTNDLARITHPFG